MKLGFSLDPQPPASRQEAQLGTESSGTSLAGTTPAVTGSAQEEEVQRPRLDLTCTSKTERRPM